MDESQHLKLEPRDDVLIVRVLTAKLFDPATVYEFDKQLLDAVNDYQPRRLLIDFQHVARTATGTINTLLMAKKRLLTSGGDLVLFNVSDNIRQTFRVLRMDGTLFLILEDEREAVQHSGLDPEAES